MSTNFLKGVPATAQHDVRSHGILDDGIHAGAIVCREVADQVEPAKHDLRGDEARSQAKRSHFTCIGGLLAMALANGKPI